MGLAPARVGLRMVRRAIVFTALLMLAAMARAQQRPSFVVQPGGGVAAMLPASIINDARVRKHLNSGLTTTFLLTARQRGREGITGARVEVRYDLWDEVWIARRIEMGRRGERQTFASQEALEKWWRMPLRLLTTDLPKVTLQVDLNVLPFSAAEEDDARQWISKSGGVGTSADVPGLVHALIGTTITAKPITTYRWNVELSLR